MRKTTLLFIIALLALLLSRVKAAPVALHTESVVASDGATIQVNFMSDGNVNWQ